MHGDQKATRVLNSDSDGHGWRVTGKDSGDSGESGLHGRRKDRVKSDRRSGEAQVALVPAAQEAPPVSLRPPRDPLGPPPGGGAPGSTSTIG
jgi:hypothetical protein